MGMPWMSADVQALELNAAPMLYHDVVLSGSGLGVCEALGRRWAGGGGRG